MHFIICGVSVFSDFYNTSESSRREKKVVRCCILKIRVVGMPLSSQEVFPIVSALSELQLSPQSEEMVTDKSSTEDEVSDGTMVRPAVNFGGAAPACAGGVDLTRMYLYMLYQFINLPHL